MLGNKTSEQWVAEYARSHQHPLNQLCHTIGIPMICMAGTANRIAAPCREDG